MARKTLTQRLNELAEKVERKANIPHEKEGQTASKALDRLERAVKHL